MTPQTPQGFIFSNGTWIGEGKISFNVSPEFIKFYTKWQMTEEQPGIIRATQIVEMLGVEEHVINSFTLYDITPYTFSIQLENGLVGIIIGKGIIEPNKMIAWEFRNQPVFEGFEVYEQQENGDYFLHAEYSSSEQLRTTVEGLIWQKG